MPTSVACPKCGRSFEVPADLLGKRLRCLQCQHVFAAQAAPPPETALQAALPVARRVHDLPPEEEPPPSRDPPRIQRTNHGVPGYLWPFAALPWGLLVLALGGCVWGLLAGLTAALLSAAGIALVLARQWPVALRLAGLLALDSVTGVVLLAAGVVLAVSVLPGPGSGPGGAPNQPIQNAAKLPPAPDVALPPVRPLFTKGPRVYLADLQEFGVQAGPWPFGKNGQVNDGKPIKVNGTPSPKGLSMHPPMAPGFASVRYRLGKQAALFRATVAIDDTSNWCFSPATFTVLGDGKPLWQSVWIAHNHTHTQACSVAVSGVDVLELGVQCVNGNHGVHAVWVEPRLLQKADTPDQ